MRNLLNYLKLLFKLGKVVTSFNAWFGWPGRIRTTNNF